MSIEEIIRAWKAEEEDLKPQVPDSPVGRELSEEELLEIEGALPGACTAVVSACTVPVSACTAVVSCRNAATTI